MYANNFQNECVYISTNICALQGKLGVDRCSRISGCENTCEFKLFSLFCTDFILFFLLFTTVVDVYCEC